MESMENKKAIVIGAGISGLSAALELKKRGFEVAVLERESRAGGVIGTVSENGFLSESGSNSVMVQSQKTLDMLKEWGLESSVETALPTAKKRFFARYGKPQAVPMGPIALITTSLFSFFGKLRMLCEPFIGKSKSDSDPSVAEFTIRRFGQEVLDYAMNPFMGGIYGGNPEKLSMRHAFPPFWNLEQKYGSVIRGGMKARKEKMAAGNFFKPLMISFKGGMGTLPESLAEKLGDSLKLGAKIISIDSNADGWEVSWGTETEDVCESYDALVIAVPSPEIAKLPLNGTLSNALSTLSGIVYAPVASYTMGFRREDVAHKLDGFGVLTPKKENFSILGSLFVSSIFDSRAPEGFITLTNYVGGMRNPSDARLPQGEMRELVLKDLRSLLGVKSEPAFERVFAHEHAIAQYNVGYGEFLEYLDELERRFPNLCLVGSYRGGVGVSSCLENGALSASKLASRLI